MVGVDICPPLDPPQVTPMVAYFHTDIHGISVEFTSTVLTVTFWCGWYWRNDDNSIIAASLNCRTVCLSVTNKQTNLAKWNYSFVRNILLDGTDVNVNWEQASLWYRVCPPDLSPWRVYTKGWCYIMLHNNNKKKKPREITWTKNRFSGQNHKNTNSESMKNKTVRNQITTKKIPNKKRKKNK
jgi:hypothetical protein